MIEATTRYLKCRPLCRHDTLVSKMKFTIGEVERKQDPEIPVKDLLVINVVR